MVVKLRLAGLTVAAAVSPLVTVTVTAAVGCVDKATVNVPLPPSATLSSVALNTRARSLTSIVNVKVSLSLAAVLLSESVTVYVYVVALCVAVGVPDSTRVEAVNVTPAGNDGDSE